MTLNNQNELLSCIEIEPNKTADKSIIWLHGLGADGSDFVPMVSELNLPSSLNIRFIFPHAPIMPVTVNNGYEMRAWHDISELSIRGLVDEAGIAKSLKAVKSLIEKEIARGIKNENILVGGFSQGAAMALMTGLSYDKKLAGIIALSGYLPLADKSLTHASDVNKNIPIFLGHGTEDMVVPYALGKAVYVTLKQAGYPIDWHSYPIGHSVSAQEIMDIKSWIQKIW